MPAETTHPEVFNNFPAFTLKQVIDKLTEYAKHYPDTVNRPLPVRVKTG